MKVLILNGSPRRDGSTAAVLKAVYAGASVAHEVEWVDVNRIDLYPCVGCLKCRPDGECVLPEDDAHRLGRKIDAADVLVIGTPTYWGNMTGPLKALLDRNVPVSEFVDGTSPSRPVQKGKKAIVVTTSSSPWPVHLLPSQGAGAVRAVKTVLRAGGYRIVGTINVPGAAARGQVPHHVLAWAEQLGKRL
jgi:multimeric flavodoxin WrbA